MKIPRRTFLNGSLLGLGATVLGYQSEVKAQPVESGTFAPSQIVQLGKTGIKLSRVGLGTGMSGFNRASNQTRLGQEKFTELVRGCYDRGIKWFDAADIYGSHPFLKPALSGVKRDDYTLVSKIWFRKGGIPIPQEERPDADGFIERFLTELGTDHLDLVLLHCMTEADWPTKYEKQMKLMDDLKKKGVIRAHGVSCHSLAALQTAASEPWVDSIHTRINPYGESMDDTPEKVVPVLRTAHDNGKGIVGMKIIGAGKFRDSDMKRDHSIDFALNLGCVDTMVVGFESLAEVDDFAARMRKTARHRIETI